MDVNVRVKCDLIDLGALTLFEESEDLTSLCTLTLKTSDLITSPFWLVRFPPFYVELIQGCVFASVRVRQLCWTEGLRHVFSSMDALVWSEGSNLSAPCHHQMALRVHQRPVDVVHSFILVLSATLFCSTTTSRDVLSAEQFWLYMLEKKVRSGIFFMTVVVKLDRHKNRFLVCLAWRLDPRKTRARTAFWLKAARRRGLTPGDLDAVGAWLHNLHQWDCAEGRVTSYQVNNESKLLSFSSVITLVPMKLPHILWLLRNSLANAFIL